MKASVPFEQVNKILLKDEEFRKEYEKLKPRYEAIEQGRRARKKQHMSQAELAKRVGTQNSNIKNDRKRW